MLMLDEYEPLVRIEMFMTWDFELTTCNVDSQRSDRLLPAAGRL
jgi:hypothetical protein